MAVCSVICYACHAVTVSRGYAFPVRAVSRLSRCLAGAIQIFGVIAACTCNDNVRIRVENRVIFVCCAVLDRRE